MQFRHFLLTVLGAGLSFACGSEEPSITVNQKLMLRRGDVLSPMMSSCGTVQRGHGSPDPGALTFYKPDSNAPDLEIAQGFDSQHLTVVARVTGTMNQAARSLSFDDLLSHSHDTLIVKRATATDGSYELTTWGGDCDFERRQ
jgi:hypothetical protein